jgi:predicted nucleotidyltransferase
VVSIPASFEAALASIREELAADPRVDGILFFGSAARGTVTSRSDIDLYAIVPDGPAGHLGHLIEGVPVEVSIAPLEEMRDRVAREVPTVAHAFATGRILLDRRGEVANLCRNAAALWERGPSALTPAGTLRWRFKLTDLADDLEALAETSDDQCGALLAAEAVRHAIDAIFAAERRWTPPTRQAMSALASFAPETATRVRECAAGGFPTALAVGLVDEALACLGGRLREYDTRHP